MPSPVLVKLVPRALFVGLLGFAWWSGGRTSAATVAPHTDVSGTAGSGRETPLSSAAPDAIERYGFRLTDVTTAAGIDFRHVASTLDPQISNVEPHVAGMGAAVSVADVDNDGWPDFYTTTSAFGQPNALYRNRRDGTFEDISVAAGVADVNRDGEGASMGSAWGDVDNDGDEDLLLYKWGYAQLFRNNGDLTFTDVTVAAGLRRWMNCNSAIWFDFDRDGLLDIYAAGYFPEALDLWHLTTTKIMHDDFEFATNGGHNVLWRNLGPGADGLPRFADVTAATGCDSTRWTLALASADFDEDGWPDLYLANDYGPEELFRNVEGKRFELLADIGLSEKSKSGMAVALGDIRNDGRLAVYVTNITKGGFLQQGNNLRLNLLKDFGRFENIADGVVVDAGWAWGAQFGDLNNDGWQDIYVVNGFISADPDKDYWYDMGKVAMGAGNLFADTRNWSSIGTRSLSGYERSRVLLNQAAGRRFIDVAAAVGANDLHDGRAVALADLWNRGVLDVLIANQRGPLLLYRNETAADNGWISFRLTGGARSAGGADGAGAGVHQSNRSGIGAQLTLHFDGRQQVQVVEGGSGFCSQNDRRLHFGLGPAARVERAVIRWPSGREQTLPSPQPFRLHELLEPE